MFGALVAEGQRINAGKEVVLALFAASALSLACLGLYATVSYVVSLRRREIGLRVAIGATRTDIVRHFLTHGLRVAGAGCLAGVWLSLVSGRALAGMLYGVSPSDPVTLLAVTATVLLVAALAALIPSMRAAFIEPIKVLREQ